MGLKEYKFSCNKKPRGKKKRYFQTEFPIRNQINLMVASHSQPHKSCEILRTCQMISSGRAASLPSALRSLRRAANAGCIPAGPLPYSQAFRLTNHYILRIFFNSKLPVCYFTLMALTVKKKK